MQLLQVAQHADDLDSEQNFVGRVELVHDDE
jgi:hypothetical protein